MKKTLIILFTMLVSYSISYSQDRNLPSIEVRTLTGNTFNIQDLDNEGKPMVMSFWATWCKPCVREIPSLNNLYKKFKSQNFEIIAINVGQNAEVVNNFINSTSPIDFTILLDENIDLVSWKVEAIPTTFLVDDKGTIIYKVEGEKHWDSPEFISFISSFLN